MTAIETVNKECVLVYQWDVEEDEDEERRNWWVRR